MWLSQALELNNTPGHSKHSEDSQEPANLQTGIVITNYRGQTMVTRKTPEIPPYVRDPEASTVN